MPPLIYKELIVLIQLVTTQEIDAALKGIDVDKALGLDEITWNVSCNSGMNVFKEASCLKQVNTTTYTLVPKVLNATRITDCRLIACR